MILLFKSALYKIKKSFGRFLSVVLIVALGTGFFSGLREASPDMLETIDKYYDDSLLMDYKITSTMGLTDDDITSLEKLKYVDKVIPSYSVDVLSDGKAIRLHAISDKVNKVILEDGKMPSNHSECLADASEYKVGDTINFEKDNLSDFVNISSCKVSGTITSALYLSTEKGIANVGNGKLEAFVYIPEEDFTLDYYTEAYILAKGSLESKAYSDEYEDLTSKLNDELQDLKPIRETKRYEEILEEAMNEISKAENEINTELEEARQTLENTKNTLDSNKNTLLNTKSSLDKNMAEVNSREASYKQQISDGKVQITNGRNQINNELSNFGLTADTLDTALNNLKTQVDNCTENCEALTSQYNSLNQVKSSLDELNKQEQELLSNEEKLNTEISNARQQINSGYAEVNQGLAEIENGYAAYNDGLAELQTKTDEANQKISEEKAKLNDIEKPVWYLLDRTSNNGYTSFYEDASKVEAIATVFPVFFILVAMLMCLNTMSRLIEEERTEIGIFTSLGYSNLKIILGYLFYCLIATFIGVTVGISVGGYLIPSVVYSIYNANYVVPDLIMGTKEVQFSIILTCASLLMAMVAIYVCHKELKNKPAILLRPKAPKDGKKVLLERWKSVWKRISFTWKITIRNMFRYKKRVLMTIIGVAGCTALLLTGFGLRDGINGIGQLQYSEILRYDMLISLDKEVTELSSDVDNLLIDNNIKKPLLVNQEAFTFEANDKKHDVYLISPENKEEFVNYIYLHSTVSDQDIELPKYGAVITTKMAQLLDAKKGSTIKIRDTENNLYILYVADITNNYTMHYIYMSPEYRAEIFGTDENYNLIMADLDSNNYDEVSSNLLTNDNINAVNYSTDNIESYNTIIKGMNQIVYLIIGAALLLAIIVLYNLLIINMTERKREIATLKVLGFKNHEISSYVYRETIILMIIGIVVGIFLGILLHQYVIITAETDNIMFLRSINLLSFVYAILLTVVSSIIVEIITYKYLLKIDMVESLKALDQ